MFKATVKWGLDQGELVNKEEKIAEDVPQNRII